MYPAPMSAIDANAGEGELLWTPSAEQVDASRLAAYERWLEANRGLRFVDYAALWTWSIEHLEDFWDSIREYFDALADGDPAPVLASAAMPGAKWFPGLRLNYAEHVFRHAAADRPALIARREDAPVEEVSWDRLAALTGAFARTLRARGIRAGDRVAAYLPNRAETVAAFLACASVGAVWSSCSPDMGPGVVIDRLRQIEPRMLLATDSYSYGGRIHDRRETVASLLRDLPSVATVVHVPGPLATQAHSDWRDRLAWDDAVAEPAPPGFERLAFDHPLWIVYSSGTCSSARCSPAHRSCSTTATRRGPTGKRCGGSSTNGASRSLAAARRTSPTA